MFYNQLFICFLCINNFITIDMWIIKNPKHFWTSMQIGFNIKKKKNSQLVMGFG